MELNTIVRRQEERPKTSRPQRYVNIKIKDIVNKDEAKIYKIIAQAKPYLKNKDWTFNFQNQFTKSGISNLLNILDLILIESLIFHFCKCSTILKSLSDIQFPRLKSLSLPGNKINSIEHLQRCSLPCLKFLQLRQNNIVQVRSIVKLNCDKLNYLEISQSKIVQINHIWKKAKFVENLTEFWGSYSKHLQLDNHIIKIDFSKINRFRIAYCNQMIQCHCSFLKSIIIKKHSNMNSLLQKIRIYK